MNLTLFNKFANLEYSFRKASIFDTDSLYRNNCLKCCHSICSANSNFFLRGGYLWICWVFTQFSKVDFISLLQLCNKFWDERGGCYKKDWQCFWQQHWCQEDSPWNKAPLPYGSWECTDWKSRTLLDLSYIYSAVFPLVKSFNIKPFCPFGFSRLYLR